MLRFMQRFGRDSQTTWRGTGPMTRVRRRNHQLNCEALESRQLLSGYYIVNAASGKVLDDPNFSATNGAAIDQWQLNGGSNQQGNLVPGKYGIEVKNAFSGKLLEDPGSSKSNGTPIIQDTANGGVNQQWNFVKLSNGNYEVFNESSGKVLDDPGSSLKNGTQIIQYTRNGGLNQQWVLLAASNAPAVTDYVVNASSGEIVDDPAFSRANGTLVQQYPSNGATNTPWTFVPLADGNDEIVNAFSHKVLDDPAFSRANGTRIQQYQPNGGMNQQWVLFVPQSPASLFPGWSGYVAAANFSHPQANSVSYVSASWIVPTVTGPSSGLTGSLVSVGMDGFANESLELVGTEQKVVNGVPVYGAWWDMYSTGKGQVWRPISSMTVVPGDSITASVRYIAAGTHAGDFYLSIVDHSRPNDSFNIYASSEEYQSPVAQRSTAEWTVEGDTVDGNIIAPLPDFGSVTFTSASAVINGVSGGINAPSRQVQPMNLSLNGVTYDTTSVLTHSGTSFAVIHTVMPSPPP